MVFHWSLSDSKFPQVSRTHLSILADLYYYKNYNYYFSFKRVFHTSVSWSFFTGGWVTVSRTQVSKTLLNTQPALNNTVIWMVSTRLLISKSSFPCINPLVTFPSTPIRIGIPVVFIFHCFFSSLARSKHLSRFSLFFSFILWSAGTSKSTFRQVLSFVNNYYLYYYLLKSPGLFSVF